MASEELYAFCFRCGPASPIDIYGRCVCCSEKLEEQPGFKATTNVPKPEPCCEAAQIVKAMEELEQGTTRFAVCGECEEAPEDERYFAGQVVAKGGHTNLQWVLLGLGPTRLAALQSALAEKRRRENKKKENMNNA